MKFVQRFFVYRRYPTIGRDRCIPFLPIITIMSWRDCMVVPSTGTWEYWPPIRSITLIPSMSISVVWPIHYPNQYHHLYKSHHPQYHHHHHHHHSHHSHPCSVVVWSNRYRTIWHERFNIYNCYLRMFGNPNAIGTVPNVDTMYCCRSYWPKRTTTTTILPGINLSLVIITCPVCIMMKKLWCCIPIYVSHESNTLPNNHIIILQYYHHDKYHRRTTTWYWKKHHHPSGRYGVHIY